MNTESHCISRSSYSERHNISGATDRIAHRRGGTTSPRKRKEENEEREGHKERQEKWRERIAMDLFIVRRNKNRDGRCAACGFVTTSYAVMSTALVSARESLVDFRCLLPFQPLLFKVLLSARKRCNQLWRLQDSLLVVPLFSSSTRRLFAISRSPFLRTFSHSNPIKNSKK